jgi:dsRNA-specific ribonuclease
MSFVISNYLYVTKYPDFDEGNLTNLRSLLVNTKSLSEIARELNHGTAFKTFQGRRRVKRTGKCNAFGK